MEYLIEHNKALAEVPQGKYLLKDDVKQKNLIKKDSPRKTSVFLFL